MKASSIDLRERVVAACDRAGDWGYRRDIGYGIFAGAMLDNPADGRVDAEVEPMLRWTALPLVLMIPVGLGPTASGQATADDPETFFELKIRPVLAGTCVKCHGADKASGGLRLDSRES